MDAYFMSSFYVFVFFIIVPTITLSGVEVTDLKTVFSTGKPASMAPETTPLGKLYINV